MKVFLSLSLTLLLLACCSQAAVGRARIPNLGHGTKIVGGRPATQGEVPYQVSMYYTSYRFCEGALVTVDNLQVVLTAAQCTIQWMDPNNYNVKTGDIKLSDKTEFEQTLHVDSFKVHENYTMWTNDDIAILFLNSSFLFNENVQAVALPTQGQVISQGNVTVSGFGSTEFDNGEESVDLLQIVKIPLVSDTDCQRAYEEFELRPTDSNICAGSASGDVSPCYGDAGAPAVTDDGHLAGIWSFAYECGHPYFPAVFTKVSSYVDWIHSSVADYKRSLM